MKYSLAIFDMDGTILNTLDDMTDSLNEILTKYKLPLHTVEEVRFMVGNGIPKLIERALPDGRSTPDFDVILADFIAYYEKHCAIKTAPYAGVVECIKTLRGAGLKIAVNTNKVEPAAIALCDDYFPGLFDIISGSRPGMPPKPAPDGIYEILKRAGMDGKSEGQRAVFIGDSDVDMQTGMNAGLDVIGVDWGFRGKKFLEEHGAPIVMMNAKELSDYITEAKISEKAPIRVAQIIGKWLGGGVEAVVMNYYRHIDTSKIQFDFICDDDSTDIPYEEIEKRGGKVILVPPYQKLTSYLKTLKKIFKEGGYKIVHSNINTLSVFPLYAARKAGVPVRIAHSHSTSSKKEWKKNLVKNLLRPFSKCYPTHYFCCSEVAGRYLFGNSFYNKGKVSLWRNAVETERFKYNEEIRKLKRKELGIADSTFVVGHIGRFVAQKNHEALIDIFAEIHKRNADSLLVLAGKGPLMEHIKEKVSKLGLEKAVLFLGQRKDAAELYQAFDTVVLPSLYEGLVVVMIEAQAAGLKCFCADTVSPETKITPDLEFIPAATAPSEWAEKIISGCQSFERKDSLEYIKSAGYDISTEAKKLEDFYLSL